MTSDKSKLPNYWDLVPNIHPSFDFQARHLGEQKVDEIQALAIRVEQVYCRKQPNCNGIDHLAVGKPCWCNPREPCTCGLRGKTEHS
jgi:hypothetical protein